MEYRNPVLKKLDNDQEYSDGYGCCSRFGIFGKTTILLLIAMFTAVAAAILVKRSIGGDEESFNTLVTLLIVSGIVTLISGIIASFSVRLCPVFSIIYAAAEGISLGFVSMLCDYMYPGIALTALLLTFAVAGVMGVLYFTGLVKAGKKLRTFVLSALIGYLIISIVVLIANACGSSYFSDLFFGDTSVIAWGLSILMVIVAAVSLVFDYDYCAQLIEAGADKKCEWHAAFGLAVGIIYLYIRILELLLRIMAKSKK